MRLGASRQLLRCLQEVTRLCEGPCGSAIFHHLPFASSCADHVPGVTRARFYGARLEQQSMSGAAACRAAALSKGAHKHGCSSTAPHMSRKQVHSCLKACLEAVAAPQRRTKGFGLRHHTSTQSHCIGCRDVCKLAWGWRQLDKDVALPECFGHTRCLKVHRHLHLLRWHKSCDEGAWLLAMALLLQ